MIIEKQTWKYDIRDAFYNILVARPFFAGFTYRKNKFNPVLKNLIPYLGVYVLNEITTPDGDANAGCVRFVHNARIGFSCVVTDNDQVALEGKADAAQQEIMVASFCDLKLLNVLKSDNPEDALIEAISRGEARTVFGSSTQENETPFAELEYVITATYRSEWYPDIPDELDTIHVETGIKPGDTFQEMAARPQVIASYDLTTARRPPRKPWLLSRDQRSDSQWPSRIRDTINSRK